VSPVLATKSLRKRFGGITATDDVSLDVTAGEVHALIGPNGAGKSTLIGQLAGTLRPDGGTILCDGLDVTRMPAHKRVAHGLARSYQITSTFRGLTVLDNLVLAVQATAGSSFRFWRPARAEASLYDRAREVAALVDLSAREDVLVDHLSHGEERQLEVGLALASRPRILLLDEPMAGMGKEESARMLHLIERLRSSTTVLLVEHDMAAVFRLADRITVLVYGRVIASGKPDEIRGDREVREAYLGTAAS
jgi:branched-chain amino acid transport system ATP-binding protein